MQTNTIGFQQTVSKVGFALTVLFALTQLLQVGFSVVLQLAAPDFLSAPYGVWVLSYAPLYLIAVPIFVWMLSRVENTLPAREKVRLGVKRGWTVFFISVAALYIFNIVSVCITMGIGLLKGSEVINPIMNVQASSGILYNFLFGVLVAPIGEELLFRGLLYKKLGGYGDKAFILVSALAFAVFHGNLSQIFYAFALGAIFAYVMAKTGNILYSMLLHIIINAYGMVIAPTLMENTVALGILAILMIAGTVTGIVLFIRTIRKKAIELEPGVYPLPEHAARAAVCNLGMGAYLLFGVGIIVLVTLL